MSRDPGTLRVLAVPRAPLNATHEFCPAISLRVNPTFGNNPRWLWESVALFANGEFVDPRTLGYMVQGRHPTLAALDADPSASRQVYEGGYVIAEFIVARAGRDGLRALVRANGQLGTIGFPSSAEFEAAWAGWVRDRYQSPTLLDRGPAGL